MVLGEEMEVSALVEVAVGDHGAEEQLASALVRLLDEGVPPGARVGRMEVSAAFHK